MNTKTTPSVQHIDWKKCDGLIPAIVQDADTAQVLMLGYMNAAALTHTEHTGRVTFWSRSKQRLWTKGETSGNFLTVVRIMLDCDYDTLLITARPHGPVCHTGTKTCFADDDDIPDASVLLHLAARIKERQHTKPENSYTAMLLESGIGKVAQKVGEEGVEVALAAALESDARVIEESADLLFHLSVLLAARDIPLTDVLACLRARFTQQGEK